MSPLHTWNRLSISLYISKLPASRDSHFHQRVLCLQITRSLAFQAILFMMSDLAVDAFLEHQGAAGFLSTVIICVLIEELLILTP